MSKKYIFRLFVCFLFALSHGRLHAQPSFTTLPEMSPLPFEHFDDPSLDSKVSSEEQLQWDETQAFVDRLITSDLVRGLSRYALPQMETYNYHPSEKTALRVIGTHQESVLYEVTLDELPSHSKLVTRHLKLYIVGLRYENQFLPNHFYLTIRGERFE